MLFWKDTIYSSGIQSHNFLLKSSEIQIFAGCNLNICWNPHFWCEIPIFPWFPHGFPMVSPWPRHPRRLQTLRGAEATCDLQLSTAIGGCLWTHRVVLAAGATGCITQGGLIYQLIKIEDLTSIFHFQNRGFQQESRSDLQSWFLWPRLPSEVDLMKKRWDNAVGPQNPVWLHSILEMIVWPGNAVLCDFLKSATQDALRQVEIGFFHAKMFWNYILD